MIYIYYVYDFLLSEYNRSYIYKHLDTFELVDCNHQFEDQTKNIRIRLKSKVQLMGVM